MIYTFWEGRMPDYIKLCLETWKVPFTVLNYDSLQKYTDIDTERIKRFTLPQQADAVRVHVLRDNGGVWLDADTIMVTGQLPKGEMIGDPIKRTNTIGYLRAEKDAEMYKAWAEYQDNIITGRNTPTNWDIMGNAFTDPWVKMHNVTIENVRKRWPETYMIQGNQSRPEKYKEFYFNSFYMLSEIEATDILMLHNSWTPGWYREMSREKVLGSDFTLSNILRETILLS